MRLRVAMDPHDADGAERLRGEDRFVRALLQRMVGDPHLADDLAQETWLAVLRQQRAPFGRAWLSVVARNCALQALRGRTRRLLREQAAARPELDAAPDVVAAELRERVLAAVERLGPAERALVRARFFDDRSPAAIAAELGAPVETVRTRLKRALQRLRRALRP
jgi:RNA polymerase sigma-70 factor (ECF subfamily)